MAYTTLRNLSHDGVFYAPGTVVELDEESAKRLIAAGVVETSDKAAPEAPATPDPLGNTAADSAPEPIVPTPPVIPEPVPQPAQTQPTVPEAPVPPVQHPTPEEVAATLASVESSDQQNPGQQPS